MSGSVILIAVEGFEERAALNAVFSSSPHHLVFALDGEDALERFAEVKPDLILAATQAHRLDGPALCRRVRQFPRGDQVPILLIAPEGDLDVARALAEVAHADGVLTTPFPSGVLASHLIPLLTHGRPSPEDLRSAQPVDETVVGQASLITVHSTVETMVGVEATVGSDPMGNIGRESDPGSGLEKEGSAGGVLASDTMAGTDTLVGEIMAGLEATIAVETVLAVETPGPNRTEISRAPNLDLLASFPFPTTEDVGGGGPTEDLTAFERGESEAGSHVGEAIDTDVALRSPFPPASFPPAAPLVRVEARLWDDATPVASAEAEAGARASAAEEEHHLSQDLTRADSVDVLEERPHIGDSRAALLEEPQISAIVPRPPDHSESSEKRRLIHEPTRERTPSAARPPSGREPGAGHRGLDESQLGKRLARRVRTMHQLLATGDHYQLLEVSVGAAGEAVRRAYFDLSLEFHPDRFFLLRSGDLKEKIYAIYRRISEAYDTLGDPRRRQVYDEERAGTAAPSPPHSPPKTQASDDRRGNKEPAPAPRGLDVSVRDPKAQKLVELADLALAEGDINTARLHLHLATAYEASNASLESALARVTRLSVPGACL